MQNDNLKKETPTDANNLLAGLCFSCKFWERTKESEYSKDMGDCSFLSGKYIPDGKEIMGKTYPKEEYPDIEKTGIGSYPICQHDGAGFTYETKSWFGCVHYNAR
jgi:hypothetical protein